MTKLPQHIAIVCDGNRRWAKKKGLPEFSGHRYAIDITTEKLIDHCLKLKIPYLTFWVLSTENWKRGQIWMKQYFKLMRYFINKKLSLLTAKGAKIMTIGNLSPLPQDLQTDIEKLKNKSKKYNKINLTIAINYGSYDEITRAVNQLIAKGRPVTVKDITKSLDTRNLPNPDLLVRTGQNNTRLSGFMLWQIAYTQLYFTDTLFPDLTPQKLDKAIDWYQTQTQNLGQ